MTTHVESSFDVEEGASLRGCSFGARFRGGSLIKQGRGIDTWLCHDTVTGARVIVKTVAAATVPRVVASRLEHEADVLARLRSPYLTPLVEVARQGDLLYLVEPFVEGESLHARLRAGPLRVRDTLVVARCVLSALAEVHAHGVVHRDVKPSNVIVTGLPSLSRAVLIDFGLSRSNRLEATLRAEPAGTALYMSPEQAGLIDAEVDHRSDLYSFGVLLFECLAGRPPFLGSTITEVLRQHLTSSPPELSRVGGRAPRALEVALQRLLLKDPRDRYQSAEGVLADIAAIEEALARGVAEPSVVVGLHDHHRFLTEPAFVGRERELDALAVELDRARRGSDRGALVLLEAESGGGKTRLLGECAYRAAATARVLRGQGVAASAQRPFQLLLGVAMDLLAAARSEPALGARLRGRLGDFASAICGAFPDLREPLGPVDGRALGPEALGEARTVQALVALLDALGSEELPALVLLDDVQWADEATLKLLWEWHLPLGEARRGGHVLVVVSFRSEEVGPDHPLRRLRDVPSVVLSPMSPPDIRGIVTSMAGELPEEAARLVVDLAEGSPFMATAVLRGMVESGALIFGEDGTWRVDPAQVAGAGASREAAVFLKRRLELLPSEVLRILSNGAVLGRDFEVDVATELSGQSLAEARGAVAEARRRHIVWLRGEGARCVFAHDKLREAVLARLGAEERRRHHWRAALLFERTAPSREFDIAYHFDAAGESGRALPYALAAAIRARSQYALEIAEQQYRIAWRGAGAEDAVKRREIAEGLGEVLLLRGRYEEAVGPLEDARGLAQDEVARARIEGKLGELAFKRGDVHTASAAIERGLRILGRFVPGIAVVLLAACIWEVLVQALHTIAPGLFLARRALAGSAREFLAVHLYSRLAHAYWFERGRLPTLWAHLREMNLAERYPPTLALAQAYSEHAPVLTMIPLFPRGIAYARRSYEIRKELEDLWGQGQSLHFLGVVLYAASRFEECIARCREAVALLERTGDRWEISTARWHIAYCLYRLGDLRGAVDVARSVNRMGREIGDVQASGLGLVIWSKASRGLVPEGLLAAELARPSADASTRAELQQAEAVRLLHEGRAADAARVLRDAQRVVEEAELRQEYVAPVLPWLATALRSELEAVDAYAPSRRAALLAEACRVARRARRIARTYRNNLPHALRERARLFALRGDARQAHRCFDESLAVAERLGMRAEAAETRLARGRVGALHGSPTAAADLAEGARALRALEEALAPKADAPELPVTVSLADRFDQILEAGRRITAALTRDDALRAACAAATTLLRGERCLIVKPARSSEERSELVLPADAVERPSESVLRRAAASGKPVIVADTNLEDPGESVVLSGARSVLAAPIHMRGELAFLLYVTHRQVGRLFGEVEERLAEFITALVGAALENAAGFAETQKLAEQRARLYREAQDAVRARDEFLSVAAHELKTPLTPLAIQIQSLLRTAEGKTRPVTPEQNASRLADTRRQLVRFEGLVNNLLDVSRIVNGRLVLELEELDLAELARDVAGRHAEQLGTAGSELRLVAPEPVPGRWDRLRLEQVVTNLLANAIKFGPGKPIDLEVRLQDGRARLAVRDRGIGIEPQDLTRIFERFERASSLRHYAGMGLGLWITRQIVEALGGTIHVTSEPGQGSTFTVDLPLLIGAPVEQN